MQHKNILTYYKFIEHDNVNYLLSKLGDDNLFNLLKNCTIEQ